MQQYDARVDAYIEKSAEFAKPILKHLRELVHRASPEITETMKWSSPFFEYKGILCHMMAFKQHLGFGFWKADTLPDPHGIIQLESEESAAGSIGRISSMADLPEDDILIWYIRQAMALKDSVPAAPTTKKATTPKVKPAMMDTPDYLSKLLEQNATAQAHFEAFSPSQKKEYITWFEEAKTEGTREKRLKDGLEWMAEGKTRHWKYK